ncbi:hypothetical protein BDI4_730066 [Burkholderia diffusa]|nr:hypothetical protein BDI4_730066 [Burkholderia diffusa]
MRCRCACWWRARRIRRRSMRCSCCSVAMSWCRVSRVRWPEVRAGRSRPCMTPRRLRKKIRSNRKKGIYKFKFGPYNLISVLQGGIAQLGERLHGMQEVSGSIPLTSTIRAEWIDLRSSGGSNKCFTK